MGRETALQPVQCSDDGWLRTLTANASPDPCPAAPALPSAPWPVAEWDGHFRNPVLPADFQWLRTSDTGALFSLTDRPGHLRLYGRESVGSSFRQALVARRQEHFRYTATTRVAFEPADFQQAAGLICYYNSTKFHYLHITRDHGARQLAVMSAWPHDGSCTTTLVASALPDGAIDLRVEVTDDQLRFGWRGEADEAWQDAPETLDASILSDEASLGGLPNFTGTFVGMACQDMAGTGIPADFSYFRYEGRDPD